MKLMSLTSNILKGTANKDRRHPEGLTSSSMMVVGSSLSVRALYLWSCRIASMAAARFASCFVARSGPATLRMRALMGRVMSQEKRPGEGSEILNWGRRTVNLDKIKCR